MNTPDFRNYKNAEIDKTIDAAMTSLRTITGNSMDLNIMNVKICSVSCALVSIEGMISTSAMSELIFRPIMELSAQKSKGNEEQEPTALQLSSCPVHLDYRISKNRLSGHHTE